MMKLYTPIYPSSVSVLCDCSDLFCELDAPILVKFPYMLIIILLKLENELIKTYECIILVGEMIKLMGLELQLH
jgi:hypothetical protein